MFEPPSRYADLPVAELRTVDADGEERRIRYVRRRFVPQASRSTELASHIVRQGDRLDTIAARHLADPTQFWRLCDANGALRPEELIERPGRVLSIPLPEAGEP